MNIVGEISKRENERKQINLCELIVPRPYKKLISMKIFQLYA